MVATKEEVFGKPEDPTQEQLDAIDRIADKLGDRAPSLRAMPAKTKNEAQAIIDLYGMFA